MKQRKRSLPEGWYPFDKDGTIRKIRKIEALKDVWDLKKETVISGVVPHAGWEFSGRAALEVFLSVAQPVDTCVIVGGHLPPAGGIYAAFEDVYETPLGPLTADLELLKNLKTLLSIREDTVPDNTVEIQLPFVKYAFPDAHTLWLRASPSEQAVRLGEALREAATALKKSVLVIGSTDLTHYGPNYQFMPHGSGEQALRWVKDVNDKRLIDFLLNFDFNGALNDALTNSSACSAGGAVAAAAFARASGAVKGKLLSYYTSYDIFPHDSFVGYAGIIYTM